MFCYMMRDSMDGHRYDPNAVVRTKTVFDAPLQWQRQRDALLKKQLTKSLSAKEIERLSDLQKIKLVFTASLTDIFHPAIDSYRNEIWDIIRQCPEFTFQILTKRPERITEHLPADWGEGWDNVWLGTSVGSNAGLQRIVDLHMVKSKTKFLSIEPMWGEVDLSYPAEIYGEKPRGCCSGRDCGCMGLPIDPPLIHGIHWVIVGGESGNDNGKYRYRPCDLKWIAQVVETCKQWNVPVFVKQLGTHLAKEMKLSDRHGGNIDEFPANLQIREFPKKNV